MKNGNNALEKFCAATQEWLNKVKYNDNTNDVLKQMLENAELKNLYDNAVKEKGDHAVYKQFAAEKDKRSFTHLVKEWVEKDYCTPKFKAEVILDTLLSSDIEKLIKESICDGSEVTLLAKEFPISNFQKTKKPSTINHKGNNAVDYVAYCEKKQQIFFVELKTAAGSFEPKQLRNYIRFAGKGTDDFPDIYDDDYFVENKDKESAKARRAQEYRKIFPFYKEICIYGIKPDTYEKAKGAAFNVTGSEKYIFQLAGIYNTVMGKNWSRGTDEKFKQCRDKRGIRKILDPLIGDIENFFKKGEYKISVVYITLTPIGQKKDKSEACNAAYEIHNIVLDENMKPGEKDCADAVLQEGTGEEKIAVHMHGGFYCLHPVIKDIIQNIKTHTIGDQENCAEYHY